MYKNKMFFLICFLIINFFSIQTASANSIKTTDDKLFNLLILHNNDMHSRFEETSRNSATCHYKTDNSSISTINKQNCVGGFARTAYQIRKYRKEADDNNQRGIRRPVLYLNAGDTYVGTPWFSVHKWKIAVEFLNLLKPDAMSLGNHEFDNGVAGLEPFVENANFPIIGSNLDFRLEPSLASIKKSVVLDVDNRKIGLIGHLTTTTKEVSSPGLVKFFDVVESVRNESERLHSEGIDIIIVVGHSGYTIDKEIAAKCPLVDIVIGGHTNTFQWNGPQPDQERPEDLYPTVITQEMTGKKVPVVQAYAYTKYLGRLNVTFDDKGDLVEFQGQPLLLDTNLPQDRDVLDLLDKYRPEIDALTKKVVGKSKVILDSTSNRCRVEECNFGNFIADAMVAYMVAQSVERSGWTDVPIGLINGGGIRTTIDPTAVGGNVTRGDILGALPFGNQIVSFSMTGADLWKTLEIGVRSNGETSLGEFLQVSGLKVVYDMTMPSYSRVKSVLVRCGQCKIPIYQPIENDKFYNIVSVSFLTNGGDGHYLMKNATRNKAVQDLDDVDLISWFFEQYSPVYPEESGRIVVEKQKEPTKSAATTVSYGNSWILAIISIFLVQY